MAKTFPGIDIGLSDCIRLVRYFLNNTFKRNSANEYSPLNKNTDSLSFWIPKERLDQLFSDNGAGNSADYGLRVYFGMHCADDPILPSDVQSAYTNQHTAILVVTKKDDSQPPVDVDMLDSNDGTPDSFRGRALETGRLCPPMCDGAIIPSRL